LEFPVWGADGIDAGAITQMQNSMRLPITAAGALMPDAHVGYGLPIGGVLATMDAVIPFAVGVDIACRMRLSVYDVSPHVMGQHKSRLEKALLTQTHFGMGSAWPKGQRPEHEVLDDEAWKATKLLRGLQFKAMEQLGSSGSGNHFVEWGEVELAQPEFGMKAGKYLALLSHSGSRAVGMKIANEYSKIAVNLHPTLENAVRHLAWLPMESEPGAEYWLSMELAGRFASANHAIIHKLVAKAAGFEEVASVENHHNFAWRETLADGTPVIVHRKGATPAGEGVLGVIPGSMGDPGFVVRGKGVGASINSASHGAGRKMGRKAAINSLTKLMRDRYLQERNVTLLGGGLDEAPQAYKDIDSVLAAQDDLVEVVAKFTPRIVRMADEPGDV
jgi:tRNA-splicing ligase RtcB